MQKTKTVKATQRKTTTGKTVAVKGYSAKYDSSEDMAKEAIKKRSGAGMELSKVKKAVGPSHGVSPEDYKAWYHWDEVSDPKNKGMLEVKKKLKAHLGDKGYKEHTNKISDSYSSRGHNKAYTSLSESEGKKTSGSKRASIEEALSLKKQGKVPIMQTMGRNNRRTVRKASPDVVKGRQKLIAESLQDIRDDKKDKALASSTGKIWVGDRKSQELLTPKQLVKRYNQWSEWKNSSTDKDEKNYYSGLMRKYKKHIQ
jgi:hypothetical protein